jgi:hypothetical protein
MPKKFYSSRHMAPPQKDPDRGAFPLRPVTPVPEPTAPRKLPTPEYPQTSRQNVQRFRK